MSQRFKNDDFFMFGAKNIMNQYYADDVARKIRRVTAARAKVEPLAGFHYGYITKDKKFYIYKPEAKIVKRIFEEAKLKTPISKIVESLKNDKIYNPRTNYYIKTNKLDDFEKIPKEKRYNWTTGTIYNILNDEFYKGVVINFDKKKTRRKSSLDYDIRIENNHKPIISKEEYDNLDRSYFKNPNNVFRKDQITHMLYCKKCLSRHNLDYKYSSISPTVIDGKEQYFDYQCRRSYPIDIMNKRIYDVLQLRYKEIRCDTENYINKIIKEKYDDVNDLREFASNKKKYELKSQKLFESFLNGEINVDDYKKKTTELSVLIDECSKKLKMANLEDYKADDIRNRVNKFLNHYYVSDNIKESIKEYVYKAIYDPDTGGIEIILKLEHELDIPSKRLESLVKIAEPTLKDFNLDDIVYDIIKNNPHIKAPEIHFKSTQIFNRFTLSNVNRSLRSLRLQNKIKFDGKASLTDGYIVLEYKDNLNYNGLTLNQREKDIFRMLWNNPKLKYEDIVDATGLSLDWVRRIIKKIRRAGGFADKRFDKTYIPDGYMHSIYVDDARITSGFVQNIYKDIDENPNITVDDIVAKYNISLDKATIYLERRRNMINANNN